MSEEPGPERRASRVEVVMPRPVEARPRGWPSEGSKLLAIVAALVGLALLIAAFLGGFLLPVAKDCPAPFADQAAVTGACHEAAVPMEFVWLAFVVVGGAGVIYALVRTYFSLRPQALVSRAAGQASFVVAQQQPLFPPQEAGEHSAAWVPDPVSHEWREAGWTLQPAARIRSLANEKAQLGDNTAFLAELVVKSQTVSTEMSTCIRDLQKLQTYLVNSSAYDQASLLNVVRGVNSECNTARADSDSLAQTIQALGK